MNDPTELSEMPGHLIRRLNQRSTAVFQERMKAQAHDLTSVQFAALTTLQQHPEIDQASLAGLIAYDRATIGGVLKRLEEKGLIERPIDLQDRRARKLRLTGAGAAAIAELTPIVRDLQAEILAHLTDRECETLLALIKKALQTGSPRPGVS